MPTTSLDSIPLVDLKPYDVYQLQAEYHCYSPQETYLELCRQAECHPSKAVAALLPTTVGAWSKVESLDLSRTYVGPKGALPVIDLCRRLPNLRSLNLSSNYLQNDSIWFLAQMATYHPCLTELDVSNNGFVSWSGAMCLATAVVQNARLTFVNLLRTAVEPETAEAVFFHTRRNAVAMALASGRTAPSPSPHPVAIHLRAMRRFYEQSRDPSTGFLTREDLVVGYGERLHTLGRGCELEHCDTAFFDCLKARAPSDRVTWEIFVVLVLLDAVEYVDGLVAALRRVFVEFNVNATVGHTEEGGSSTTAPAAALLLTAPPSAPVAAQSVSGREAAAVEHAVCIEGFVEVEAFPAIHARLYGESLSAKDAAMLKATLGFDEMSTGTVNWTEFLYMWYGTGPVVGAKLYNDNVTKFPRRIRVTHY